MFKYLRLNSVEITSRLTSWTEVFFPYFYVNGSTLYEKDELVFDKFEYVSAHQGIWLLDWRRCHGY